AVEDGAPAGRAVEVDDGHLDRHGPYVAEVRPEHKLAQAARLVRRRGADGDGAPAGKRVRRLALPEALVDGRQRLRRRCTRHVRRPGRHDLGPEQLGVDGDRRRVFYLLRDDDADGFAVGLAARRTVRRTVGTGVGGVEGDGLAGVGVGL